MQQRSLQLLMVAQVKGEYHPERVFADIDNRYLGHVPGFRATGEFPGNGDLVGDVTFRRRNVDAVGRRQPWVTTVTDPLNAHRGHLLALESATREDPVLALALEGSASVRDRLGQWNSLTPEDRQALTQSQQEVLARLRGAVDRRKKLAYLRLGDALGQRDTLGRANPTVTATRHLTAERLLLERYNVLDDNQRGIISRLAWSEAVMARVSEDLRTLYRFVAEREILTPDDVTYFYGLAEGLTLKPVSQMVGYLCYEIERGGGRIDDPSVLSTLRGGFHFERLMGWARETVRPLARLSETKALVQGERLMDESGPELQLLDSFLGRFRVGGPYDRLIARLHRRVQKMRLAMEQQAWKVVIHHAKAFQYTLVYRSHAADPAPVQWYSLPPGHHISEQMERYYRSRQTLPCP